MNNDWTFPKDLYQTKTKTGSGPLANQKQPTNSENPNPEVSQMF